MSEAFFMGLRFLDCFFLFENWLGNAKWGGLVSAEVVLLRIMMSNFLVFSLVLRRFNRNWYSKCLPSVQFSSVAQSCLTLCDPMDCSMPGFPVHYQLPEPPQTHVHHVSDAIQPSHPLSSPSNLAFNLSQHQALFQWISSLHQVAKVLEFQFQHQSFQWTPRTDLL